MPNNANSSNRTWGPQEWRDFLLAVPIVAFLTLLAWQVFDLVRAENILRRAAQTAAHEATLPQATSESIARAARRVLHDDALSGVTDNPIITINHQPILLSPLDLLESGDHVEVTLGAHAADVVPDVLRPLGLSLAGRKLHASASACKP